MCDAGTCSVELTFAVTIAMMQELCLRMMGSMSLPEFFSRGHDKFDFFVTMLIAMVLSKSESPTSVHKMAAIHSMCCILSISFSDLKG